MINDEKKEKIFLESKDSNESVRNDDVSVNADTSAPNEEPEKKFLTEEQLTSLDNSYLRLKTIDQDKQLIEMKILLEEKDLRLLQAELKERAATTKERIQGLNKRLEQLDSDKEVQLERNKKSISGIAAYHNIDSGKFGYNPETHEVIVD